MYSAWAGVESQTLGASVRCATLGVGLAPRAGKVRVIARYFSPLT